MKRMHNICLLVLLFLVPLHVRGQQRADTLAWRQADWNWVDLGAGARAGTVTLQLFGSTQCLSLVTYPASKFRTGMLHAPEALSNTTDSLARRAGARFAINGSYFDMKRLIPHTFFSIARRDLGQAAATDIQIADGVLAIRRRSGHRIEIFPYDSTRTGWYRRHCYAALGCGPILLLDGAVREFNMELSFNTMRHPRSFIGLDAGGQVYLVVADGRFPGQGDGASIPELAWMACMLGLTDAINLDGGGSSTLWTDRTGILNHPSDNGKFDHEGARTVPNILTGSGRR